MKKINKVLSLLSVPALNFTACTLHTLEGIHASSLKGVGLTGYNDELGKESSYRNNLSATLDVPVDGYYFSDSYEIPLIDLLGLNSRNFFQNIYQVCYLLQYNWKTLKAFRSLSINEHRTEMLFPFINYNNNRVLGHIGVHHGNTTFSGSLDFDDIEDKPKTRSVKSYFGECSKGFMIVLPANNDAVFLQNKLDVSVAEDYTSLSVIDFKNRIKSIEEEYASEDRIRRLSKIQERIRVDLSYVEECYPFNNPVKFAHPEEDFYYHFGN